MYAHISIKGQIVIPAVLRRKYGLKPGMTVRIMDSGDGILLKPVSEQSIQKLEGILQGKGGLKVLLEERARD
ncbi:MAG: AbrB/MazE/SpoVT family DNA-binding domain-containing protein [Chloroflexota bacterium]